MDRWDTPVMIVLGAPRSRAIGPRLVTRPLGAGHRCSAGLGVWSVWSVVLRLPGETLRTRLRTRGPEAGAEGHLPDRREAERSPRVTAF